jgi:hypothetical protein
MPESLQKENRLSDQQNLIKIHRMIVLHRRTHTQHRFKVTPWTIHNLSNGKYSVRGQSSYPGQNTGIEQRENDYPNHHILNTQRKIPLFFNNFNY